MHLDNCMQLVKKDAFIVLIDSSIIFHFLDDVFPGHQAVHPPSVEYLSEIARGLKIDMSDQELKENQG